MSAYIVDRNHIRFLIEAARYVAPRRRDPTFRWYHDGWHELECSIHESCDDTLTSRGQLLWDECRESVAYRYPDNQQLSGPINETFIYEHVDPREPFLPTIVEIFSATDCYEYQSCEHPGWHTSNAHDFIQQLRSYAWHLLPGYDEAPWGAPEVR